MSMRVMMPTARTRRWYMPRSHALPEPTATPTPINLLLSSQPRQAASSSGAACRSIFMACRAQTDEEPGDRPPSLPPYCLPLDSFGDLVLLLLERLLLLLPLPLLLSAPLMPHRPQGLLCAPTLQTPRTRDSASGLAGSADGLHCGGVAAASPAYLPPRETGQQLPPSPPAAGDWRARVASYCCCCPV